MTTKFIWRNKLRPDSLKKTDGTSPNIAKGIYKDFASRTSDRFDYRLHIKGRAYYEVKAGTKGGGDVQVRFLGIQHKQRFRIQSSKPKVKVMIFAQATWYASADKQSDWELIGGFWAKWWNEMKTGVQLIEHETGGGKVINNDLDWSAKNEDSNDNDFDYELEELKTDNDYTLQIDVDYGIGAGVKDSPDDDDAAEVKAFASTGFEVEYTVTMLFKSEDDSS